MSDSTLFNKLMEVWSGVEKLPRLQAVQLAT